VYNGSLLDLASIEPQDHDRAVKTVIFLEFIVPTFTPNTEKIFRFPFTLYNLLLFIHKD
jgi:hypothetical protein